jgi:hypothetical protein
MLSQDAWGSVGSRAGLIKAGELTEARSSWPGTCHACLSLEQGG